MLKNIKMSTTINITTTVSSVIIYKFTRMSVCEHVESLVTGWLAKSSSQSLLLSHIQRIQVRNSVATIHQHVAEPSKRTN